MEGRRGEMPRNKQIKRVQSRNGKRYDEYSIT